MNPPPRVLLFTNEPPHTAAAGAILFHRLFADYPPDRLLVVSNERIPAGAGRLACRYEYLPLAADRLKRTRLWPWRPVWRALGGAAFVRLGRVHAALRGFEPDVVVTLMQDSWYYDLAARFARSARLPVVLFVHDVASIFEPVGNWLEPRQRARDAAVYRQAAVRICVSEAQAGWLRDRLGAAAEVIVPPRSPAPVSQPPERCGALKSPDRLTLGYAGGLHYGYGEQLLAMAPELRRSGVRVHVAGPRPAGTVAALAEITDVFTFHGYVSPPERAWALLLNTCDAVLQPYRNPPGAHALQYRTHFPSKLGDMLSLGLPVFLTGPEDAAGIAWCRAHPGCALTVTEPGDATLRGALRRLRDEPAVRVALARAARAVAPAFDPGALRAALRGHLARAVRPDRPTPST
ncbi:MAG TPA: glycosyltransferase [Opitutaceae bacterium]|nr:glycosyltransferase [Opitutaceae bacterium]